MATIYKAQPTGDQVIPNLDLHAVTSAPDIPGSEFEKLYRDFYAAEGKIIADALCASLPGGTLDALLVEMLDRKRSLLRVKP
jgi:hypothetical protein